MPRRTRYTAISAAALVPLAIIAVAALWLYPRWIEPNVAVSFDPTSVETMRDCPDCPDLVVVPAGSFAMGSHAGEDGHRPSEGPMRVVSISSFAIGRYEVTFGQWDACVAEDACSHVPNDRGWGRSTRPVFYVSRQDIQDYLAWLTRKAGASYRLPSEAEWEYAARAGTTTRFWWGDEVGYNQSNCVDCPGADFRRTMPVGSFNANPFGLYDVHGNVAEWTDDCWNGSYAGAPADGSPWLVGECDNRVVRGGAWGLSSNELRSAYRAGDPADLRSGRRGFRVARDL